jgi:predicted alpha/beta hydrolase
MSPPAPEPLTLTAADGFRLGAHIWRHHDADAARPITVIAPATSVACRYYARFAAWLHGRGRDVLTFDYRGIGVSRPPRLQGFAAGWLDWGRLDLEAALRHARLIAPGRPLDVVAHSIGGCALGLAPSNHHVRRAVTVGAQYAYWRDYAALSHAHLLLKWNLAMPALTALLGYMPARRLGWMEDTPAGVVSDWTRMTARLEDRLGGDAVRRSFRALTAPMLVVGLADDPLGTERAILRLAAYYDASPRTHLHLAPADIGAAAIGHFAFFHDRFATSLWPIAAAFLDTADLPAACPGRVTRLAVAQPAHPC